ncbi:type 4a pilus biogenesis protein PilO [Candidatus Gottesmanbacteria bacterium]|nr:type 4a pilus biogenesis protein PilO [Candidatus Gottesmanbacteria bacterium]
MNSRYYQSLTEFVKKPKTTIYTGAIFSFLAVSLFGWYAIRPTLQTILFLRREIEDNKVVSKQMEEKISKLIEAHALYQSIKPRLPLLAQALPEDPAAISVVAQLKNLATTSGATISAITVTQVPLASTVKNNPTEKKPTAKLTTRKVADTPILMVVGGTYQSIKSLLGGIVNLRRLLTIDTISVIPEKSTTGAGPAPDVKLRMVVKLQAHYLTQ